MPIRTEPIVFNNDTLDSMVKLIGYEWTLRLKDTLLSKEFDNLYDFLQSERHTNTVYPLDNATIFRAFSLTPFDQVRVVILGQDPYHDGSADGLAFSNGHNTRMSPSLKNIMTEIETSVYQGLHIQQSFDLSSWSAQGVLLLNTALTVRKGQPLSHMKQWDFFIKAVLHALNIGTTGIVYLLWGAHAQSYEKYINSNSNHILKAAHPASPVYGGKGWFGCNHFATTNALLNGMNGNYIHW